jgi:tetratricopeptide (TPR) repeat protein
MDVIKGLFVVFLISIAARAWRDARLGGKRGPRTLAEIQGDLERAELLLLDGRNQEGNEILRRLDAPLKMARGSSAAWMRVWHSCLTADLLLNVGRRDLVKATIDAARAQLSPDLDADLRADLAARLDALTFLVAFPDSVQGADLECAARALNRARAGISSDLRMRLVWIALWTAQYHLRHGEWPKARPLFERSIELGEQLAKTGAGRVDVSYSAEACERFWGFGRTAASAAALELANVAESVGDREQATAWFRRSVELLDGVTTAEGLTARARARLQNGIRETADAISGPGPRLGLLEEAIRESLAAQTPEAYGYASRAEIEIASTRSAYGAPSEAKPHLRRAVEYAERAEESAKSYGLQAQYLLAQQVEAEGDVAEACRLFASAYQGGRFHASGETRHLAFHAGRNLHRLTLIGGESVEARTLLEQLENLVPGLEPAARPAAMSALVHARAHQFHGEGKEAEGNQAFEEASRLARRVSGSQGLGLNFRIATDRGIAALASGRFAEAVTHFDEALSTPEGLGSREQESVERAEVLLQRAQALLKLDREREAVSNLERAFVLGRDSGSSRGRELAASAALLSGDLALADPEKRRRHYESATRFGQLSGRERGKKIAEAAELRLREAAE